AVSMDVVGFMGRLRSLLEAGDVAGAHAHCESQGRKPMARIIAAGLANAEGGAHKVQGAMDEVAYTEIPAIEKRTGYLALLGNVATLMGLFGTIIGLIHSFSAVSKSSASDNATLLAAGISEAMNCTAFGLVTGIFALLAFSFLNGRTQGILDDINLQTHSAFRLWRKAMEVRKPTEAVFAVKPINAPHAHLMAHTGLLRAKGGGRGKKGVFANLQLTPLIDMFIVILIFLLMSFQASGEIVSANKDIKLPLAVQVKKLNRVPIVSISYPKNSASGGVVTLENREVSTARELLEDTGPDWKIAKLTEQLERMKANWKITNPDKPWLGKLIIQADQNVDFKIIKKVMYSAGVAGYGSLLFAVRKAPSKGDPGGEG
ncbi:MAG: MotA/TolQ/ExbB proton channel family protein, partial [Deltaproteobacteria bacterium]|nr:MotA/TolQ/ExbB proton channel family protein [Deltaproteobacteria bacterium]